VSVHNVKVMLIKVVVVMIKRCIALVLFALSCCLPSACNIVPPSNLKSPELSFSDLSIGDIGLDKVKLIIMVAAKNPNDIDIPLSNMKFDLTVLDTAFGSGTPSTKDVRLPKLASSEVPIEFVVPTSQLLALIRRVGLRDLNKVAYSVKGSAQWNNGPFTLPFERKGEFSALKKLSEGFGLIR
jgi:LEA14-like dessication related protein